VGQLARGDVKAGEDTSRLQRERREPRIGQAQSNDPIGPAERASDVTCANLHHECLVRGEVLVHNRRARDECLFDIANGWPGFVVDRNQINRVRCRRSARRDDCGDR